MDFALDLPERQVVAPCAHPSFVSLLRQRAEQTPDRLAMTFGDGQTLSASLTYQDLDCAARALASRLQSMAVVGKRAVILMQPSAQYVVAILGCWYARLTAVPVYSPKVNASYERVRLVLEDAGAEVILSTQSVIDGLQQGEWPALHNGSVQVLAVDGVDLQSPGPWVMPNIEPQTLAVLQYTSGSTGKPKGVRLQHRHLLKNSEMIQRAMASSEHDVGVAWLPPYHDMGLIGSLLQPLYCGFPVHLIAPATFLQRPHRWLEMISRLKATVSAAPNFAYDLCARRLRPEQLAALDLSSWRLAANGAEPIRAETLDAFAAAFAPAGFSPTAFQPCYGMAETTLLVSASDPHGSRRELLADPQALKQGLLRGTGNDGVRLVSSGRPDRDAQVRIVDPQRHVPLADGQVGEIWIAGPMVADGYWNNPEATRETFLAGLSGSQEMWLRTGDLGALHDAELYVTGRIKDLIIIRGHNHYPTDIESTVMLVHPAIKAHGVAAYAYEDSGEEALGLVVEVERGARGLDLVRLREDIVQRVSQVHQLKVSALLLTAPNRIARTSSGKIQRGETRDRVLAGAIAVLEQEGSR
ncbi:fatty acyl-AMP ligase [Pseudomonas sp. GD03858]|uniref:fatty acyl-AMP ligase n=1 Tax=unclassified Pseudomonas TaxID=196821 RepID=UPI00244CD6F1|nr:MULTISPECIES: fatty acyl-AMP ligase [unclassified Pseudomonas]MDH0648140.1 fatty acyl-AMP ligase [Pseudomonas sp. GD03867]MDH0663573.1 fatty acyl-AMP ligase [Pseudomonas sp. GD03858]